MTEKCLTYKVKSLMCESMNIGNTQQKFKKIIDGHLSNLLHLLKNGQKPDSFAAHSEQHFNATTSHTYLRTCTEIKLLKQLNLVGEMKKITKLNCNLCMEERLMMLKNLPEKQVMVMNKNLEIYGASRNKKVFHQFCLSTDEPI